jgi:ABC-2 type transport system ATP-binding protein
MTGTAIEVEDIVKRYGDFEAVKGVSFSVAEGEIFGLLGPNGAGKSTLIRMMTTLIPLTSGRALVVGHDVARDPDAVRRMIGVIPQALTSDPDLTVEENLSIYAKLYSVPKAQRIHNIHDVLEAVDLVKWRGAQVKTLSGGMRRRVEIARGLVHNPSIFFLDEPTTGLDPVYRVHQRGASSRRRAHGQNRRRRHHPGSILPQGLFAGCAGHRLGRR